MSDEKPSDLVKALSRLAGSRCGDGTSSLVIREDRETIINGCYDMMMALRAISAHTDGNGWQDIASAPKDGTWIIALRPRAPIGRATRVEIVRWGDEQGAWIWADHFDVFEDDMDEQDERGFYIHDPYEDVGFTHFMPLPKPPVSPTISEGKSE